MVIVCDCRLPSYMARAMHVPASNTLWALLIGLVLFAITTLLSGHFIGDTKVKTVTETRTA